MTYDAQDNCRSNTPMDSVQELVKAETNTASEEHQILDEIYTAVHDRASIEYYMNMRRKRE